MRVIENYNPSDITQELINGDSWDYIVLNKKVNSVGISNWWEKVESTLYHMKFNFVNNNNLLKPPIIINGTDKAYETPGNHIHNRSAGDDSLLNSYTLTWTHQRYDPLPPIWAADIAQYPELNLFLNDNNSLKKDINIDFSKFVYLEPFVFGEFKKILDEWGARFWRNIRVAQHMPGLVIPRHTDGFTTRLHIPLTIDNSSFLWGDTWDREYKWTRGNMYLINSHITHCTTNFGPSPRANLLSSIQDCDVLDLLKL